MANILIVDDDELVRDSLQLILEREGHRISLAADGDKAITSIGRSVPDLAIVDIIMPNREGIETIRCLRRDFPELRIIATSGGSDIIGRDYLEIARKLGAHDTIAKPFRMAALTKKIDALLHPY